MGKGTYIVEGTLLHQDEYWIEMPFSVASMQGTPFADISELTDVSEGLIVRTIVQLDET